MLEWKLSFHLLCVQLSCRTKDGVIRHDDSLVVTAPALMWVKVRVMCEG